MKAVTFENLKVAFGVVKAAEILVTVAKCTICDKRSIYIGVFIPDNPMLWGGYERKNRLILYGLCKKHFNRGTPPAEEIERKIQSTTGFEVRN